ncbi:MAG: hypothetical protein JJU10_02805 [Idiomarina sp.]|nr:hypothetical protein [Idiomarina sp.]
MVQVDIKDNFHLRVTRELGSLPEHSLDLCLFVPGELSLTSDFLSENAFYQQGVQVRRTYQSTAALEPLVRSRLIQRLAKQNTRPDPQYRLGLSLYAYQYVTAMERAVRKLVQEKPEDVREALAELIELSATILRRLRRNRPEDDRISRYFVNIDNYLSWFTEQQFLKLAGELTYGKDEQDIRDLMVRIARRESRYREEQQYNAERIANDSTRLSNKMRLLRRLIEYPISMRRVGQELGAAEQKAVKAGVAAVVMSGVSFMILQARDVLGDITAIFILLLALLYAARELFKDDLREKLWRWLRKGRPKWKYEFYDVNSEQVVGKALEWFDYKHFGELPETIRKARKGTTPQRGETVVWFRSWSRMLPARFLSGYAATREAITLDLSLLHPLMNQSSYPIYREEDGEVLREDVERRYTFNLIIREQATHGPETISRWKVFMNHSRIVGIEETKG